MLSLISWNREMMTSVTSVMLKEILCAVMSVHELFIHSVTCQLQLEIHLGEPMNGIIELALSG